ncbi:M15 family metallopeptidase [Clostridium brassicae]|uniref:M15 family metallopeptidase n=1 Tax=Clostridium brassicae TaxID=2999072 RepID=A0ABT4DCJ7_9CLOT|nr:M15 family metallopeptidase [Clostridium brassicae]MCY6960017.1 M15 family metallopeptidase [Clostridium brassicae]
MKKIMICFVVLFMFFSTGFMKRQESTNLVSAKEDYEVTMKRDILCLMMAYPEYIKDVRVENDKIYLVMNSGNKVIYDDKREKKFDEKVNNPDIQDMMEQLYPLSDINNLMDSDYNPGRVRIYPLLKEVYGSSKSSVEKNLVNVRAGNKQCLFNKNNNAANSLKKVMEEINSLSKAQGNIYSIVFPVNGTFNYRVIAGTNRLSPHSFGTAIDLKSDKRDYWKWASREQGQKRLESYPREVVEIFEKNNFIWGGKWGKFDILHFEYRPELILKSRYFGNKKINEENWYEGAPFEDNEVKKYITLIDKTFSGE